MADTITPTPSPHAEAAKAFLDKLRALRTDIPRFVAEAPREAKRLIPNASLPDAMLESASVAIQASPRLEQASGIDAATLRDSFGFALAWDAVVHELVALARNVAHTIRVQRAEAGKSALDVYAIARSLARKPDGAELLPYVDDMRKKLKQHKRPRKAKGDSGPATAAVQPAPPAKV